MCGLVHRSDCGDHKLVDAALRSPALGSRRTRPDRVWQEAAGNGYLDLYQ